MGDLTIVTTWSCTSSTSWSARIKGSKGNFYEVTFNAYSHKNRHSYHYDYACTCQAYRFGSGAYCKHIDQVKASGQHCNWQQLHDGGDVVEAPTQPGMWRCPKCHDRAYSDQTAV